jgi:hypothetical protein
MQLGHEESCQAGMRADAGSVSCGRASREAAVRAGMQRQFHIIK